jgi:hypothetical protein
MRWQCSFWQPYRHTGTAGMQYWQIPAGITPKSWSTPGATVLQRLNNDVGTISQRGWVTQLSREATCSAATFSKQHPMFIERKTNNRKPIDRMSNHSEQQRCANGTSFPSSKSPTPPPPHLVSCDPSLAAAATVTLQLPAAEPTMQPTTTAAKLHLCHSLHN